MNLATAILGARSRTLHIDDTPPDAAGGTGGSPILGPNPSHWRQGSIASLDTPSPSFASLLRPHRPTAAAQESQWAEEGQRRAAEARDAREARDDLARNDTAEKARREQQAAEPQVAEPQVTKPKDEKDEKNDKDESRGGKAGSQDGSAQEGRGQKASAADASKKEGASGAASLSEGSERDLEKASSRAILKAGQGRALGSGDAQSGPAKIAAGNHDRQESASPQSTGKESFSTGSISGQERSTQQLLQVSLDASRWRVNGSVNGQGNRQVSGQTEQTEGNRAEGGSERPTAIAGRNIAGAGNEGGRDTAKGDGARSQTEQGARSGSLHWQREQSILPAQLALQGGFEEQLQELRQREETIQTNRRLYSELVEKARVNLRSNGSSTASIRLRPASLGYLSLNLEVEQNQVYARLVVDNEGALRIMKEEMEHIRQELLRQGFQVESATVRLRDQGSSYSDHSEEQQGAESDKERYALHSGEGEEREEPDSPDQQREQGIKAAGIEPGNGMEASESAETAEAMEAVEYVEYIEGINAMNRGWMDRLGMTAPRQVRLNISI